MNSQEAGIFYTLKVWVVIDAIIWVLKLLA